MTPPVEVPSGARVRPVAVATPRPAGPRRRTLGARTTSRGSIRAFGALGLGAFALLAGAVHAAPQCTLGDVDTWGSGFVVRDIVVTNDSNRTLVPPRVRLEFDGPVGVDDAWGATAAAEGRSVTLTGAGRGATLAAGESARFGFKGTGRPGDVTCTVLEDGVSPPPTPDAPPSSPDQGPSPARPDAGAPVIWRDDEIDAGSPGQRWRGVDDTRIVADCGGGRGQCLEVSYAPTERGSDRLQRSIEIPPGTDYTLAYDIRFGDRFEFVRGGKLPGLAPDEHTTGCDPVRPEGWSARPMWRVEGSAQGYYYGQDRTGRCGDGERSAVGAFEPGRWQTVALRVRLNGDPSAYDGEVTLSVDGRVVSRNENVRLRSRIGGASDITRFFFSTFYGGADPSWAPTETTTIRYDDFRVIDNTAPARRSKAAAPTAPSAPDPAPTPSGAPAPTGAGDGARLLDRDMDELPSGLQDDAVWKAAFAPATWANGPDEGRVYVDDAVRAGQSGKSVRVLYPADRRTPSDSGAQWHMGIGGARAEELHLAYRVRFDEDFDFVLGGKLPGLAGSVSFEDRTHEWSGRLMWRENGRVEFYTHIAGNRERWWWNTEGAQASFVPGRWHHVEMRFVMNAPGRADGIMEGWLDGVRAAYYDGVEFRAADEADSAMTRVFFSTFFGGSSGDRWNATKDEFAWFDDFVVSRERIGYSGPVL